MDTLTHIVLGACIGEAIAGKQLGKKALVLGALAQSFPDIDFVASFWLPTTQDLLAHRGITHSFIFIAIVAPLQAFVCRLSGNSAMTLRRWIFFWFLEMFIHIFIDAFNAYGTGWFEPFSHYRVSFNTMYVADPLFSIWPGLAFLALIGLGTNSKARIKWLKMGIGMCTFYLFCGAIFKLAIENHIARDLSDNHIQAKRHFTTPTPLNNLLWYIVAENDSGYFIGYRSIFDRQKHTDYHFVYKNDSLLRQTDNKQEAADLKKLSGGFYALQYWHDTLVFNDVRFGEVQGWSDPHPHFAFYYFLQHPKENDMIVQRGRFTGWNKHTFAAFLRRIKGN